MRLINDRTIANQNRQPTLRDQNVLLRPLQQPWHSLSDQDKADSWVNLFDYFYSFVHLILAQLNLLSQFRFNWILSSLRSFVTVISESNNCFQTCWYNVYEWIDRPSIHVNVNDKYMANKNENSRQQPYSGHPVRLYAMRIGSCYCWRGTCRIHQLPSSPWLRSIGFLE